MPLTHTPLGSEIAQSIRSCQPLPAPVLRCAWGAIWARCLRRDLDATTEDLRAALEQAVAACSTAAAGTRRRAELVDHLRWCAGDGPQEQFHTLVIEAAAGEHHVYTGCASCFAVREDAGRWARSWEVEGRPLSIEGRLGRHEILFEDELLIPRPDDEATLARLAREAAERAALRRLPLAPRRGA
ncbi:MAG: hypothetical protein ACYCUM_04555 [Solirubrobacteraceae bacterium]